MCALLWNAYSIRLTEWSLSLLLLPLRLSCVGLKSREFGSIRVRYDNLPAIVEIMHAWDYSDANEKKKKKERVETKKKKKKNIHSFVIPLKWFLNCIIISTFQHISSALMVPVSQLIHSFPTDDYSLVVFLLSTATPHPLILMKTALIHPSLLHGISFIAANLQIAVNFASEKTNSFRMDSDITLD